MQMTWSLFQLSDAPMLELITAVGRRKQDERILQMRSSKLWKEIQSQTQKCWKGRLRGEECENSLVRRAGKNPFL